MSKFTETVDRELEGIEHVHVGYARAIDLVNLLG